MPEPDILSSPIGAAPLANAPDGAIDIDWRMLGPDVARVNRGRQRLWRVAVGGVLLNAVIGLLGVLLHLFNDNITKGDLALYVSGLLMASSLIILLLMLRGRAPAAGRPGAVDGGVPWHDFAAGDRRSDR